jgi:hypothetical protein
MRRVPRFFLSSFASVGVPPPRRQLRRRRHRRRCLCSFPDPSMEPQRLLRSRRSGLRSTMRRRVRLFLFFVVCCFRLCLARRTVRRVGRRRRRRLLRIDDDDETPVRLPQ